jgi:hypothetical protein
MEFEDESRGWLSTTATAAAAVVIGTGHFGATTEIMKNH